jgi:hypothetical protein
MYCRLFIALADIHVVLSGEYKILFRYWGKLLLKPSAEGGDLMLFAESFLIVENLGYVEFKLLFFLRVRIE